VEGNEKGDQQETKVAYKCRGKITETQNLRKHLNYISFSHISQKLTELKCEESTKKMEETGNKSKQSYQYDLVKRGGKEAVMNAEKSIVASFYQLKTGHALLGKYLRRIGNRRDMKCRWCVHEYQTRDHLFKWCTRWEREQKQLSVVGQEWEDGCESFEKMFTKPKISLPISLVLAEEKCTLALLDFLSITDVVRISAVVEIAENSDHKGSSDGGA
jgi:hypothetical protein